MMVAVLFFVAVSMTMIFGLAGPVLRQQSIVRNLASSRQSYFLAEAGIEDVVYRLKTGKNVSPTEILSLNGNSTTVTTTDILNGKEVTSIADVRESIRKLMTIAALGSGVAFRFGIQAGNGGLIMENTSSITGNVYSNGVVTADGPIADNIIRGSVVSAGPSGLINNIYVTGSAHAHAIIDSKIDGNAYYQNISNTTVLGTLSPNSPDQAPLPSLIPDEQVEEWKQAALEGGVISSPCPYRIKNAVTIGPKKIACDLEISGNNYTVTLTGNIWVEGNILVKNSPTIKVDSSFGNKGVTIVADKPSDPINKGTISLENSVDFEGSGSPSSYVMFISQNRSAESGGSVVAVDVKNTITGSLLVYAGHGEIMLQNNIDLKEVAAYQIRIKNTAEVIYEIGIANLLFDSGPSGGYEILSWKEIE